MRSIRGVARLAAVLMVFFVVLPLPALAQSAANTGQIVGQVLDPSKAALANVRLARQNWTGAQEIAETIRRISNDSTLPNQILAASLSGRSAVLQERFEETE